MANHFIRSLSRSLLLCVLLMGALSFGAHAQMQMDHSTFLVLQVQELLLTIQILQHQEIQLVV